MTRPEVLTKNEPLFWSTGLGTDFWEMIVAAKSGDLESIKRLLAKEPSLVRSTHSYRNAISFAVQENQLEVAAYLLEKGASPVESGTGDTLLQIAKDRGYVEMQQLLTGKGGSAAGEEMGKAIRSRDVEAVRNLLDRNADFITAADDRGNQPIHWATMTRNTEMIDLVLAYGAGINTRRPDGAAPIQLTNGDYHYRGWRDVPAEVTAKPNDIYLHLKSKGADIEMCMACLKGDEMRVRALLANDPASANRLSDYGGYYPGAGAPIKNAAMAGHINIVKLLLENGADPNLPEEGIAPMGQALHSAVVYGQMEVVKLLLEHGAHPNVPVESSADTLSAAISRKDQPMIDLLCSHGASRTVDLLAYYNDLQTAAAVFNANPELANNVEALENAAGQGNADFVHLILRYYPRLPEKAAVGVYGANDSIKGKELTDLLFQHGMDPDFPNWLSIRPLHRIAERGDMASADYFLEKGADINAVDEQNCATPLGWAAKAGKTEMVRFLLEKGADRTIPADKPWAQPLSWAKNRGFTEISAVLDLPGFKNLASLTSKPGKSNNHRTD